MLAGSDEIGSCVEVQQVIMATVDDVIDSYEARINVGLFALGVCMLVAVVGCVLGIVTLYDKIFHYIRFFRIRFQLYERV
jgi:hypothetical protein